METTYYLNKSTIYFAFTHQNKKIRKSAKLKIKPSNWGAGFPKKKKETAELREKLILYKTTIDKFISDFVIKNSRQPSNHELGNYININILGNIKSNDVSSLIDYYIDYSERHKGEKTKETKKIHLESFREHTKGLEIVDLQKSVFSSFINKLIDNDLEIGTINSYLKDVKVLFNHLFENEKVDINYGHNRYIKKFPEKNKPIIALNEDELRTLSYGSLDGRLQRVVDLFLFGCYTGLRFEDLNNFTISDVDGAKQIHINKTGAVINIPIIMESERILRKYNYKLPTISNQKGNRYLKEVFRLLELDRVVYEQKNYVNRIERTPVKLCDNISFHKSRKTFITTAIRRGVDKHIVMQLADIKSESVFRKYVAYENEEGNKAMKETFSRPTKTISVLDVLKDIDTK